MNHLVHLQTKGKSGFRSKHPLEPTHALNSLTIFDREVVSSGEKERGICSQRFPGNWMERFGCRRQAPTVLPHFPCFPKEGLKHELTAMNHRALMNGGQHRGDLSRSLQPPAQQRPAVIAMQSGGASLLLFKPSLNLLINRIWGNSFWLWGKRSF